jgi:hypothetical protein
MPPGQWGAPARRTKLGDDGNQMKAEMAADRRIPHSALPIPHLNGSFPVFILGWTIRGNIVTIMFNKIFR